MSARATSAPCADFPSTSAAFPPHRPVRAVRNRGCGEPSNASAEVANVGTCSSEVAGWRACGPVAVLALALTTGCMPEPEPTPSPTGFASEEEAFAAAEETYRAYVDALNQVDLSDPETFEPVYALTTGGSLHAQEKKQLSEYHADGAQVERRLHGRPSSSYETGTARRSRRLCAACVDVSAIEVTEPTANPSCRSQRPDFQRTLASLIPAESPTGLLIDSIEGREGAPDVADRSLIACRSSCR